MCKFYLPNKSKLRNSWTWRKNKHGKTRRTWETQETQHQRILSGTFTNLTAPHPFFLEDKSRIAWLAQPAEGAWVMSFRSTVGAEITKNKIFLKNKKK